MALLVRPPSCPASLRCRLKGACCLELPPAGGATVRPGTQGGPNGGRNEITNRADAGNRLYGVVDGGDVESREIEFTRGLGGGEN